MSRRPHVLLAAAVLATAMFAAWNLVVIALQLADPWRSVHDTDFYLFWFAGRFAESHGWATLYDGHSEVAAMQAASGRTDPFFQLPPAIWLALPFTPLPYGIALALWMALIVAGLVSSWALAAPGVGWARAAHLGALFAAYPVAWELLNGHPTSLVLAAMAACWWFLRRGSPFIGGLVLGAILIKPQSAYLVPLALLFAGRWRAIAGAATSALIALGASAVLLGPAALLEHARVLTTAVQVTNARLFTLYTLVGGGTIEALLAAAAVAMALAAAWAARQRGPELPIAAGIAGSLVAVPYAFPYELVSLFLAGWLLLRSAPAAWARWALLPIYFAIAFCELLRPPAAIAVLGEIALLLVIVAVAFAPRREPAPVAAALVAAERA